MKATIDIMGRKYTSEGGTVKEALARLEYRGFSQIKSVLTIQDEENEKSIVLPPILTKRLFSLNPTAREIAIKQTAMRFE